MSITSAVPDENGNLQEHCFQIGGGDNARPTKALPVQSLKSASVAAEAPFDAPPVAQRARQAASEALSTKQLLSQLRCRLRVVEREIKTRKALETERGQILRLIVAAKQERDNVRSLRAAR